MLKLSLNSFHCYLGTKVREQGKGTLMSMPYRLGRDEHTKPTDTWAGKGESAPGPALVSVCETQMLFLFLLCPHQRLEGGLCSGLLCSFGSQNTWFGKTNSDQAFSARNLHISCPALMDTTECLSRLFPHLKHSLWPYKCGTEEHSLCGLDFLYYKH